MLFFPNGQPLGVFVRRKPETLFEITREVGERGIGQCLCDLGDRYALNKAGCRILKAAVGMIPLGRYPEIVLEGLVQIGRRIAKAPRKRLGGEGRTKAVVKMRADAERKRACTVMLVGDVQRKCFAKPPNGGMVADLDIAHDQGNKIADQRLGGRVAHNGGGDLRRGQKVQIQVVELVVLILPDRIDTVGRQDIKHPGHKAEFAFAVTVIGRAAEDVVNARKGRAVIQKPPYGRGDAAPIGKDRIDQQDTHPPFAYIIGKEITLVNIFLKNDNCGVRYDIQLRLIYDKIGVKVDAN